MDQGPVGRRSGATPAPRRRPGAATGQSPDAGPAGPDRHQRSQSGNPVLEPLFRAVRANHPKADLALLERAYLTAERLHARPDAARAATPTSPTRSRSPRSSPTSA